MSSYWQDLCTSAKARSVDSLLSDVYIMNSILVCRDTQFLSSPRFRITSHFLHLFVTLTALLPPIADRIFYRERNCPRARPLSLAPADKRRASESKRLAAACRLVQRFRVFWVCRRCSRVRSKNGEPDTCVYFHQDGDQPWHFQQLHSAISVAHRKGIQCPAPFRRNILHPVSIRGCSGRFCEVVGAGAHARL